MRKTFSIGSAMALFAVFAMVSGCTTAPKTEEHRENLQTNAEAALKTMTNSDKGVQQNIDSAFGYAIFPSVGKGGLIAGGAYGRGIVYEQGEMVGYSDMKQATVGLQAGGQTFNQLILFQNEEALDRFRADDFAFAANASAVALKPGVSKSFRYDNGIGVYTQPLGGVMFEAAIGGQRFTFVPQEQAENQPE